MVVGCLSVQVSAVLSVRTPASRELSPHHQCPPGQPTRAPGRAANARDGHSIAELKDRPGSSSEEGRGRRGPREDQGLLQAHGRLQEEGRRRRQAQEGPQEEGGAQEEGRPEEEDGAQEEEGRHEDEGRDEKEDDGQEEEGGAQEEEDGLKMKATKVAKK